MRTLYLKRRATNGEFFVGSDGTRDGVQSYAVVTATPGKRGLFSLATQSRQGEATCRLAPADQRILGHAPLRGELLLGDKSIATVSIQNEMNSPLIRAESDQLEVLVAREPFRDPYAPVFFKSIRHGILAKARTPEFALSELWNSRFGLGLVEWGSLDTPPDLDEEMEIVLQFLVSAYEFIWAPRHGSTSSTGS